MAFALGVIGTGNMAEAIVRGLLANGVFEPSQIIAADASPARRELFADQLRIPTVQDPAVVASQSRLLLLCVKPQQAAEALHGLGRVTDPQTRIISIMAGISTAFIEKQFGEQHPWRVIRAMPNTPMMIGEGIVGVCLGQHAQADDLVEAKKIFSPTASIVEVAEAQMDAVTAMSGSGPAYFFYFVEHMIHAGESLGLSVEQSRQLAIQTAVGAANMLAQGEDLPQELRRKVTSPGGTTEAALRHMETHHLGDIFQDAIRAAERRGKELSG
jgi:pyrroline-5-carboxylate reductase